MVYQMTQYFTSFHNFFDLDIKIKLKFFIINIANKTLTHT
jgi:hypothetical protein